LTVKIIDAKSSELDVKAKSLQIFRLEGLNLAGYRGQLWNRFNSDLFDIQYFNALISFKIGLIRPTTPYPIKTVGIMSDLYLN
jgi:hypothetical protein